jgi:hypothetical protein
VGIKHITGTIGLCLALTSCTQYEMQTVIIEEEGKVYYTRQVKKCNWFSCETIEISRVELKGAIW